MQSTNRRGRRDRRARALGRPPSSTMRSPYSSPTVGWVEQCETHRLHPDRPARWVSPRSTHRTVLAFREAQQGQESHNEAVRQRGRAAPAPHRLTVSL